VDLNGYQSQLLRPLTRPVIRTPQFVTYTILNAAGQTSGLYNDSPFYTAKNDSTYAHIYNVAERRVFLVLRRDEATSGQWTATLAQT